jgi:hypothetical protein
VTRGSWNPHTLAAEPPQTRGASWGQPQTPVHSDPPAITEQQRWAHTTVGVKTPRTSSSGYGALTGQQILKPNWFSWQDVGM